MEQKKLKTYKDKLIQKKEEILVAYNKNKNYGKEADEEGAQDVADKAASSYTKEFLYSLSNTGRSILEEVEAALDRMNEGEYGTCMDCGQKISKKRLDAVPWARYCVPCKERIEQGIREEVAE